LAAGTKAGSPGGAAPARDPSHKPEPAVNRNHPFPVFPATATTGKGRVRSFDYPHLGAKPGEAQPPTAACERETETATGSATPAVGAGVARAPGLALRRSVPA
jgi:hypothetical protein